MQINSPWPALGLGLALLSSSPALGGDCPPPPYLIEHHALMKAGRYAEAEREARQVVAELTSAHGDDSVPVAQALEGLALSIQRAGRPMDLEALESARRALEIKGKRLAPGDPAIADAYSLLGQVLKDRSEHRAARENHERALAIREKALGDDHPEVGESLYRVAVAIYFSHEEEEAQVLIERSLAILERALGPDAPEVGAVLALLGRYLNWAGKPAESRQAVDRSLRILERALGPDHPLLAPPLVTSARLLSGAGEAAASERLFRRAIDVVERALGPEHPDILPAVDFLGGMMLSIGEHHAAAELRERLVRITEKSRGSWSPELAEAMTYYGVALWHTGERVECRHLLERAAKIMAQSRDQNPEEFSFISQNLGLFLLFMGDFDSALPHWLNVLKITEQTLEPENYERVKAMANLAFLYVNMGRFADALPLAEKAVEIWARKLAPDDPDLARVINTLAQVEGGLGKLARARAAHERALSVWQKLPVQVSEIALDLEGLGIISLREGKAEEARAWYEKAVALRQAVQGGEHPDLAVSLEGLGRSVWLLGEPARALDLALRSEAIGRVHLQHTARGLSEREALRYAAVRPSGLDLGLTILASTPAADIPAGAARRVWDEAIRSRAVILDEIGERHRSLASAGAGAMAGLRAGLEGARRHLAQLLVNGAGSAGAEKFEGEVRAALQERDRMERALAEKSPAFMESLTRSRAGFEEVRAALPREGALVGYVLYRRLEGTSSSVPSYVAFVERAGARDPALVPLGAAKEIDTLVQKWREEAASRRSEAAYRSAAEALRRAIWEPVEPHLAGAAQALVVPDGTLSLVNLGALPAGGDRFLVEAGPRVHYLSAERDLVRAGSPRGKAKSLMALGGPDYEAQGRGAARAEAIPAATAFGRVGMYRGAAPECEALRQRRFEPLPGAWLEAREVEELWRRRGVSGGNAGADAKLRLLTGAGADERAFKSLAPGFSVIHLATHGFFAEDCAPSAARSPLLFSGLALAGANRRAAGEAANEEEDGILTAEEIVSLDLSQADWVVLSACETGVGKLEAGEGVLGLRRAFQIAGAGTVIMSLWPVEDAATRSWMKHLYEARLEGASTSEAVRSASLKTLEERRRAGKSVHPSTWGAFVAAGDWR